ncbi:MAG: ribbon-helix-helix domain-containing protein [Propionibacteriaceae bacterium]|jgi:hypothetical protein|nr:ribbon-helix-helix domain-containing protein [Propionibacteriaceae bacterium]
MSAEEASAMLETMTAADFPTVSAADDVFEDTLADYIAAARKAGRPSLTAPGRRSPVLNLVLPEQTKTMLDTLAQQRGRKPSDVAREALNDYLLRELQPA